MASEVFQTEDIVLQDGTEIELKPLPVAKMRKVMRIWSDHLRALNEKFIEAEADPEKAKLFNDADFADDQYNAFMKILAIALETQLKGDKSAKAFETYLEETLDDPTIYKILSVTANLKLGNLGQTENQTE